MRLATCILALSLASSISAVRADTLYFHAVLSGTKEKVPNNVTATGTASVALDTATGIVTYRVEYSGITGPATVVHFHGPKLPGMKAPEVIVMHMNHPTSPVTGSIKVTATLIEELRAGQWYANVHTRRYPNGEIRGWLTADK